MKRTHASYPFADDTEPGQHPQLQLRLNTRDSSHTCTIVTAGRVPLAIADIYVEYRDGQVVLYVWDETDVCRDPTERIVLIEIPHEAIELAKKEARGE